MWVTADKPKRFTLQAGTLFYPEKKLAERIQTLILLEDMNVNVQAGTKEVVLSSSCFNSELAPPSGQAYFLSNVISSKYKKGMDQRRVWDITAENKKAS